MSDSSSYWQHKSLNSQFNIKKEKATMHIYNVTIYSPIMSLI